MWQSATMPQTAGESPPYTTATVAAEPLRQWAGGERAMRVRIREVIVAVGVI